MVQRYELELYHCNGGDMEPDPNGSYVDYLDYAKLEDKVNALLADISRRYPGQEFTCEHIKALAKEINF